MIEIDSEATRDPIFVLLKCNEYCEGSCPLVDDRFKGGELLPCPKENCGSTYTLETPEGVFLTREEAESYGKSQEHNLGKKDKGWYVFCIPAEGELAKFLNTVRKVK